MIPSPILNVVTTLEAHTVPCLLMGGQACVLYGAAEFSRDVDLVLAARPDVLNRLQDALNELSAQRIAVPQFNLDILERGHAAHFRCHRADVAGLRIDVLTRPPRIPDIAGLWERRITVSTSEGISIPVISLQDLIETKKTQRDKDWAVIGSLIDVDIVRSLKMPTEAQKKLWLSAARDAEQLVELAAMFPELASSTMVTRPLLEHAVHEDYEKLELALAEEQIRGKAADRVYWAPLLTELEQMRWAERRSSESELED